MTLKARVDRLEERATPSTEWRVLFQSPSKRHLYLDYENDEWMTEAEAQERWPDDNVIWVKFEGGSDESTPES
jgi:hypothetical protein